MGGAKESRALTHQLPTKQTFDAVLRLGSFIAGNFFHLSVLNDVQYLTGSYLYNIYHLNYGNKHTSETLWLPRKNKLHPLFT